MKRVNRYNFVEEYYKSKNGNKAEGLSPTLVKPVIDSNYSDFARNLAGTKDPIVRNNADFSKTTEISLSISRENGETCPNAMIIESIVQSDDITLLSNTCSSNLNIKCDGVKLGQIDENLFKKYASVTPDEFLSFITKTDLQALVQEKTDWLQHSENFSSLLDDVLRSFGHEIDLDCY